ncbi:MAG: hypothetical protein IRZ16_24285 [Myxococcaceae bacterium]|nr:hypothetical protein [Myxococcaceae bacterium]
MKRIESGSGIWLTAALGIGVMVSLARCGGEKTVCPDTNPFCQPSGGAPSPTPERICTVRTECPRGNTCLQGTCVPDEVAADAGLPIPCRTAQDCAPGETCVEITGQRTGVCQAAQADIRDGGLRPQGTLSTCVADADCGPKAVCVNGACVLLR